MIVFKIKPMGKFKFHRIILLIGLCLWIGETVYFGFNDKPINGIEKMLDFLSMILIIWGFFGDIFSGIEVHKHYQNEAVYNVDKGEFKFTQPTVIKTNSK